MTDFLTRLAGRTFGMIPVAQPIIASRFAPDPTTQEATPWDSIALELPGSLPIDQSPVASLPSLSGEELSPPSPGRAQTLPTTQPQLTKHVHPIPPSAFDASRSDISAKEVYPLEVATPSVLPSNALYSNSPVEKASSADLSSPKAEIAESFESLIPPANTGVHSLGGGLLANRADEVAESIEFDGTMDHLVSTNFPGEEVIFSQMRPVSSEKSLANRADEVTESIEFDGKADHLVSTSSPGSPSLSLLQPTIPSSQTGAVPLAEQFQLINREEGANSATPPFLASRNMAHTESYSTTTASTLHPAIEKKSPALFTHSTPPLVSLNPQVSHQPQTPSLSVSSLSLTNRTGQQATTQPLFTAPMTATPSTTPQNVGEQPIRLSLQNTPFLADEKVGHSTGQASLQVSSSPFLRKERQHEENTLETAFVSSGKRVSLPSTSPVNPSFQESSSRDEAFADGPGASSAPIVHITIGRIDVRAIPTSAPSPTPRASKSSTSGPSLEQYLKQGKGGGR